MQVICIDASPNQFGKILTEGQVYTVIGRPKRSPEGYLLKEVSHSYYPDYGFKSRRFIPCSEISETEMVRESINQTV